MKNFKLIVASLVGLFCISHVDAMNVREKAMLLQRQFAGYETFVGQLVSSLGGNFSEDNIDQIAASASQKAVTDGLDLQTAKNKFIMRTVIAGKATVPPAERSDAHERYDVMVRNVINNGGYFQ